MGYDYLRIFEKHPVFEQHMRLIRIMMGAVSYIAMRAAKAPMYMGENLGSDQVWNDTMRQFENLIDASLENATD
jgi:hypothetical protein